MCLSTVFMDEKREDSIVFKDAASIVDKGGKVEIQTLFGENKLIDNCLIQEVNLIKNYIVLQKRR